MKTKVVLTIIGLISAVLLIGIGVFVADRMAYVKGHMEQVNQEVLGLATQLGYTPDTLLRHEKGIRDVSLGPPFDARCMNHIFFETPMTLEQFTGRLNTVLPSSRGEGWPIEDSSVLFDYFDFTVQHADSAEAQAFLDRKTQTAFYWSLLDGNTRIWFYNTLNLPVTLAYRDHPITGNVIRINIDGGRFLPQLGCPVELNER